MKVKNPVGNLVLLHSTGSHKNKFVENGTEVQLIGREREGKCTALCDEYEYKVCRDCLPGSGSTYIA